MSILEIISGVILLVCCLAIILLVVAQQPNNSMGAIGGGNMFADVSSRSTDAKMAQVTQYAGIAFFAMAIVVSALGLLA